MKARALFALALLALPWVGSARPDTYGLPLAVPERPFLLLDAPRRFLPGEVASVRVQRAEDATIEVAVLRVRDPEPFLQRVIPRDGVSVAGTAYGAEAERLVTAAQPLPRRGSLVDLVSMQTVALRARPRVRNVRSNEQTAYDSNETEEGPVETWGVHAGDWADQNVAVGALPTGFYLVRAHSGSWATTAYLSVGNMVVLARRGDTHDTVRVTDGEGRPQAGVSVRAIARETLTAVLTTDAQGEVRLPASGQPDVRFVARRGDDVAWADVTHARMEPCDPRVYLATGRPVFRYGETLHVRGHARGCLDGREAPLANEPVVVQPTADGSGDEADEIRTRTDADGNFIAELPVHSNELYAVVRGRAHRRTIQIDSRQMPQRALHVRLDRTWFSAGETATGRVEDDDGGWPRTGEVVVQTPAGRQRVEIGPHRAAVFSFVVPAVESPLESMNVHASLSESARTTHANGSFWTGSHPVVLRLDTERTNGATGGVFPVHVGAANLAGDKVDGRVTLTLRGSDGNRATGPVRWTQTVETSARGTWDVPLAGVGPWTIAASWGGASSAAPASIVVWERARPPALSLRAGLAVQPATLLVPSGSAFDVDLRAPSAGSTWLTLEQGSVWSSAMVTSMAASSARVRLTATPESRGLATVVATHVHAGQVQTATAVTEVETSRRVVLGLTTDKRVYASGERAHVTVVSRGTDGAPRDGVLSLWMANAGYWELGEDNHPSPDAFFRLPGRRASAGDSTHPQGFGSEEGRRLDTLLEWNEHPLPRSSFRHAWGYGGELVTLDVRGDLQQVASRIARDAGLAGAEVCAARVSSTGTGHLKSRSLPWDLVALRLGEATDMQPSVEHNVLKFACGWSGPQGTAGGGLGSGSGAGYGGGGRGRAHTEEEMLEGTRFFLGLQRLGPTGRFETDIPMPEHAGRWRVEALVIADDGGGGDAHMVVHTDEALALSINVPRRMSPGDALAGDVTAHAPAFKNEDVTVEINAPPWMTLGPGANARHRLDASGNVTVPLQFTADRGGDADLVVTVTSVRTPSVSKSVRVHLSAQDGFAQRPVRFQTLVGPQATDVDIPVPALSAPAALDVRVEGDLTVAFREVFENLRAPRWNIPTLRIDRLKALRALESVVHALPESSRAAAQRDLSDAITSEIENLRALRVPDGGTSWWRGLRVWETAEMLHAAAPTAGEARWADDLAVLRRGLADSATMHEGTLARAVTALAETGADADRTLARNAITRWALTHTFTDNLDTATWWLRAARALREAPLEAPHRARVRTLVEQAITAPAGRECGGPAWFLCMASLGDRARVARAARELLRGQPREESLAARALAWMGSHPAETEGLPWGTAEADVLALEAAMGAPRQGDTRFEVTHGGRSLARGDAQHSGLAMVNGAGTLRVSFGAVAGRVARVVVSGMFQTPPPERTEGTANLQRRIDDGGGTREPTMTLEFTLPRVTERVELAVPLPATLDYAGGAGQLDGVAWSGGRSSDRYGFDPVSWDPYALDRAPAQGSASLSVREGVLHFALTRQRPGVHRVVLPMVRVARGVSRAAPAWLRTSDEGVWSITPAVSYENRPRQ